MCLSYINISYADDDVDVVDIKGIEKVIETVAEVDDLPKINSRFAVVNIQKQKWHRLLKL